MENKPPAESNISNEDDSLDKTTQTSTTGSTETAQVSTEVKTSKAAKNITAKDFKPNFWQVLLGRFNIYMFVLVIIAMLAVIIIIVAYLNTQNTNKAANSVTTQNLTPSALQQLSNSDTNVGSSGQVLNVQSSAIFDGNVLAREDLQVAGNLTVGGTLAINALTVQGTSQFGVVQVNKNLSVAGDSNLQGNLTVSKSLQVTGDGNFTGNVTAATLTTANLQLNGNLNILHHINAAGASPSVKFGTALGNGGTASISGSDTAGTVTVNTGNEPSAGCFATLTFTAQFNTIPHVVASPIGFTAGGLAYYITRTASDFSVCDASTPPANSSFSFDYIVFD